MGNKNDKSKTKVRQKTNEQTKVDISDSVSQPASLILSEKSPFKGFGGSLVLPARIESRFDLPVENLQDSVEVSFSVDAGIIDRLGRELVSKKETAVSELIKNAYDADAVNVRLIFIDAESEELGELRIEDDGSGMTLDDLINGFMRISSSDKAEHPYSPLFQRQRAGRKGIGRFATQRLGHVLEIITQTVGFSHAYKVVINWDDYKTGLNLSEIGNRLEQIPQRGSEGTSLTIKNLREFWSPAQILSIYNDVSDLILPSFIFEKDSSGINAENKGVESLSLQKSNDGGDPGFNLSVRRRTGNVEETVADVQTQLFDKTLGVISAYVDDEGRGFWSLDSKKLDIQEVKVPIGIERESDVPFKHLKNVSLKTHYFHTNSGVIPRSDENTLKRFFQKKGGIRLYRNGFKVRPYAEFGDDWLNLDFSTRRRKFLFPHANDNFYGYVEVTDLKGSLFEETSSREGLLENEAFTELQQFAQNVVITAAARIAAARGKKITSSQKDWTSTSKLPELVKEMRSRLSEAISYVKAATKDETEEIPKPFLVLLETAENVNKDLRHLRGTQEKLLEEQGMLRVLASLGLIIGEFTHEIKHTLGASSLLSKQLITHLKPGDEEFEIAEDLKFNIERFKTYAAYFGRAIADNASRELVSRDIEEAVDDFIEAVNHAAKNYGITIKKEISSSDGLFTCPMHSSELASILFNLYSNAQKAILRARVKGQILISVSRVKNILLLDFCDNGDGIPLENRELIFEAFFTTTRSADVSEPDEELLQGAGLGLKIVKDILRSYQGDIYLEEAPDGYSTCFRCEIPKAEETII